MQLDNQTVKLLKSIGHQLKPIVAIGNDGFKQGVIDEVDRALNDHELIKVRLPAGSKDERTQVANELCEATKAQLIQAIGRMALILRHNPNANPKLSNLSRYTD